MLKLVWVVGYKDISPIDTLFFIPPHNFYFLELSLGLVYTPSIANVSSLETSTMGSSRLYLNLTCILVCISEKL